MELVQLVVPVHTHTYEDSFGVWISQWVSGRNDIVCFASSKTTLVFINKWNFKQYSRKLLYIHRKFFTVPFAVSSSCFQMSSVQPVCQLRQYKQQTVLLLPVFTLYRNIHFAHYRWTEVPNQQEGGIVEWSKSLFEKCTENSPYGAALISPYQEIFFISLFRTP